ncbi:hypothetical protein GMD78_13035 [Ornithinibacillus sp. L9]|uniref:Lipoprotein n=1 Tax=Ornithinibacillus caprae TaxID=2678566 RepID=A0A6N8FMQ8_9BACI|nr:hypothetical protein [Ornithinibacillus caprae]MUK89297.1 hypothetical protein [Ornithinibacillus caprae]
MKKAILVFFIISFTLILGSCGHDGGLLFEGKGKDWTAKLVATYDIWGKENQSIKVTYVGDKLNEFSDFDIFVESPDFLGWGLEDLELDENGDYFSERVFMLDEKTPSTTDITLRIEGEVPETIKLTTASLQ